MCIQSFIASSLLAICEYIQLLCQLIYCNVPWFREFGIESRKFFPMVNHCGLANIEGLTHLHKVTFQSPRSLLVQGSPCTPGSYKLT